MPAHLPDFRKLIQYNPDTGSFKWLVSTSSRSVGSPAGGWDRDHYLRITVNGHQYSAASIAWYLTYGEWPKGIIDHIDKNPANNRLDNLRDIPHGLNALNKRRWSKTGFPAGVYLERGRYRAQINLLDRNKHLGYYKTLEEATAVIEAANKKRLEIIEIWMSVEKRDRKTRYALLKEMNLDALGL
jgi:hypothetical protein